MNFKEFLKENITDLNKERTQELDDTLGSIFYKYFPNGLFTVKPTAMSDGKTFWVSGYIIKDLNDEANKIRQNDPLKFTLNVEYLSDAEFSLKSLHNISITSTPKKEHMAMGSNKISFRKSSGDAIKLKKAFENTVKKIRIEFESMLKDDTFYYSDMSDKYKK